MIPLVPLALVGALSAPSATPCSFCGADGTGKSHTFDLSGLSNETFTLNGEVPQKAPLPPKESVGEFQIASPCLPSDATQCGLNQSPALQSCREIGSLVGTNASVSLTTDGFNVTLRGGFKTSPADKLERMAVYRFICDKTVPADGPPDKTVIEHPGGVYNVVWRTPAACAQRSGTKCAPPPPAPPPVPPPGPCMPGAEVCLPSWKPTWHMRNSTVLYTCNNSGMHDVHHANQFGIVVYDWSNAKAIWANAHPMTSEELITKQAEMVYAADPGLPGYAPRVWAYRNTIKALNWYSSVREKLDDPKYASWFIKFKGFSNKPYPGGQGKEKNSSYHVPTCDFYNNGTAPRCSGFYHDQEQTPEHPGGGSAYHVDGDCIEQCDCGPTNPCGEYIFDHRGGMVDGRTFRDWWINEYMVTNETLYHKDPRTGESQVIGLGWLDDSMQMIGPTEEDRNYIADTCGSNTSQACIDDMKSQVDAYQASVLALKKKVVPMGGFWWQLLGGSPGLTWNPLINRPNRPQKTEPTPAECKAILRDWCTPKPSGWNKYALYNIPAGGKNVTAAMFTDYTAEFLLTRGPYAMLGYSWCGCTNGQEMRPRAAEWDEDFGEPVGGLPCKETGEDTGVFEREWSAATVTWDCAKGHGEISRK